MANPFGWQQVGLKDSGVATQAAIRSAQQGVRDTVNLAEDYHDKHKAIDKNNYTQQGKLNTREIANRIRESGMTAEEFAAAQSTGQLSSTALTDEFGINYDAAKAQSQIDTQQANLVFEEIRNIAKIPEDKANIEQHGVSGINLAKDRIMATAQNDAQRERIGNIYANQQAIALSKQNQRIIDRALGTEQQIAGGQGFGGLHDDGLSRTVQAEEYLRNQAAKNKYTPEQLKGLIAEYKLAEKASTDLSGTQQTIYQDRVRQHDESLNTARTHINQQLGRLEQKYQKGIEAQESVDLTNTSMLTKEIAHSVYKGEPAEPEDFANLQNEVTKKASAFAGEELSPGRVKAIQAHIFANAGDITDLSSDEMDNLIRTAVSYNVVNYKKYKADHMDNVQQYTELNDTLGRINNQAKTYKVKSMYNASKDLGPVEQKALTEYLAKIDGTVKAGGEDLVERIRAKAVGPEVEKKKVPSANTDVNTTVVTPQQSAVDYSTWASPPQDFMDISGLNALGRGVSSAFTGIQDWNTRKNAEARYAARFGKVPTEEELTQFLASESGAQ